MILCTKKTKSSRIDSSRQDGQAGHPNHSLTLKEILQSTVLATPLLDVALLFCILGAIVVSLLPPLVLERVVNLLADGQGIDLSYVILYVFLLASVGVLSSARESLLVKFGQKISHSLRSALCDKLSRLPAHTLSSQEAGAVTSRFVSDVDTVETLFTAGIISMIADACQLCGILLVIASKNRGLFFLLLVLLPLLFLFTRIVQKRMLQAQMENRRAVAGVTNHVPETLRNIRTIQLLQREGWMEKRYGDFLNHSFRAVEKNNFLDSIYSPVILLLNAVTIAAVMLLAAWDNPGIHSIFGMTVGTSVAMVSYVSQVFSPLESIGMEIQTIQSAVAGLKRIQEFLAQPEREIGEMRPTAETNAGYNITHWEAPVTSSSAGEDQQPNNLPCIRLQDVHFHYEEDAEVLQGLSFDVSRGEWITLMGRTGAGKSTVFKLILGLYQPQKGRVLINGRDAAQIPDNEKRSLFGCVEQNFQMVPGTIGDQITLFDSTIQEDQIFEAAEMVGLHELIQSFPAGYDTLCTKDLFSQGQWQLLSIARAIAAHPEILLLDEITANLDADTELAVLDALRRAGENRTVLSISHRLYEQMGGREIRIG